MNAFTAIALPLAQVSDRTELHGYISRTPAVPPAPAADSMLASRAVLRGVSISFWSGHKLDKRTTRELNESKNAESNASRVNKALLPKDALSATTSAVSRIRSTIDFFGLPWTDSGLRIMPAANIAPCDLRLREDIAAFEAAADGFAAVYPSILASAPARMGDLFDPADYPTADDIRSRFRVRIRTLPMPQAADFRIQMSEAQARQVKQQLEAESAAALKAAMDSAFERVHKRCAHMVEKLRAYRPAELSPSGKAEGIFRDSLIENIRELAELLPSFNLTGDSVLSELTERLKRELCANTAESLRDDAFLREETAKRAESILADVSDYLA